MSHHKHSTSVFVVGVGRVVRELSASGSGFMLLLLALVFVVPEFSAISTFGRVLSARAGMEAPSSEGSSMAFVLRPKLGVIFVRRTSSASSSSVQMRIEHVSFRCVAPCMHMVFFDHSLSRTAVRIALNRGARLPRHICTISLSSTFTLIEPSESQSSLIFKV